MNESTAEILSSGNWATNTSCVSRKKASFLVFAIIPSIPIIINLLILVAVALDSRRLFRENRVYAHVSSTLLANVMFSTLALVQIFSLYFNFEGFGDDPNPRQQGALRKEMAEWWAFRKALLYGMYVIMCGNIGLLIEAIRSGICIAIRSAAGAVRLQSKVRRKWHPRTLIASQQEGTHNTAVLSSSVARRRRSYISIASLWIFSLLYASVPTIGWSCAHYCPCLSSCFSEDQIQYPPIRGCSRAFPPMANSWLAVTIGVWATCLIGVFVLLKRSVVILKRAMMKHSVKEISSVLDEKSDNTHHNTANNVSGKSNIHSKETNCQNDDNLIKSAADESDNCAASRDSMGKSSFICSGICSFDRRGVLRQSWQRKCNTSNILHVNSSFKNVIWITVLYACCTTPTMVYLVADMAFPFMKMNMVLMNVCLLFPFTYCVICPFLLIKCLPGIKVSLEHLVLKTCKQTTPSERSDVA